MRTVSIAVNCLLLAALAACGERAAVTNAVPAHLQAQAANAGKPAFTQYFEATIDGKVHRIDVDHPRDGHIGGASINGNRQLNLHALDQSGNFMLGVTAHPKARQTLVPDTLEAYECRSSLGCEKPLNDDIRSALLTPIPTKIRRR
jgi:hypothetical protein